MANVVVAAAALIVLFLKHKQIQEGIENFSNHFRGGPPRPMHPSPAGDVRHLQRP